ncbi:MAG: DUF3298 domain-containing protein [Anaerolineaceae bacterium]|nr:DUF3298 domain-containing protein [Anaerolineaceae bacterium]
MKRGLRGKLPLLLSLIAACLLLSAGTALFLRQAWLSRQALLSLFSGSASPLPGVESPQPTSPGALPGPHPALVISTREMNEESKSPSYSIQVKWPVLEWGGDPRVNAFNKTAEEIVNEEIRGFKEGVAQLPDDTPSGEYSSSLNISFATTNTNNGILSVLLRISFYSAGAAHPGTYSRVINYNLRDGKELALKDLFSPGSNFLDPISAACLEDLKARGVLSWEDGALPKADNYQVWNVTPAGLLITFDEYQVAPYAAGPQAVTVSYEKLKEIIRPESPLGVFIYSDR